MERRVKIWGNKEAPFKKTTKVTIHGSCCWQVVTKTGGELKTNNWKRQSELEFKEEPVVVWTIKIKESQCL